MKVDGEVGRLGEPAIWTSHDVASWPAGILMKVDGEVGRLGEPTIQIHHHESTLAPSLQTSTTCLSIFSLAPTIHHAIMWESQRTFLSGSLITTEDTFRIHPSIGLGDRKS